MIPFLWGYDPYPESLREVLGKCPKEPKPVTPKAVKPPKAPKAPAPVSDCRWVDGKATPELKAKLSEATRLAWARRKAKGFVGWKLTEEQKAKMRKPKVIVTEEEKAFRKAEGIRKRAETTRGRKRSEEARQRMREASARMAPEVREKINEAIRQAAREKKERKFIDEL